MALLAMLTLGGITGARAMESASGSSPEGEQERLMAISVTVAIPGYGTHAEPKRRVTTLATPHRAKLAIIPVRIWQHHGMLDLGVALWKPTSCVKEIILRGALASNVSTLF